METKTEKPFAERYSLLFGPLFLIMGIVETFVRPKPDSYFGPAILVFGIAWLVLWWSARTENRVLRKVANVLMYVGVAIALVDIVMNSFR